MGWDEWSVVAGLGSAALAVAAVAVALTAFQSERRRARWENARALHHDLTTGEVAAARNRMGRLHYGSYSNSPLSTAEAETEMDLQAYYTLLWCFERINAGRESLVRASNKLPSDGAVEYLEDLIRWHVAEYACGFRRARNALATRTGNPLSDKQSQAGFSELASQLLGQQPADSFYLGEHCESGGELVCPCSCHQ